MALFGGRGKGPGEVSLPVAGGTRKTFLSGFKAPVIALATHEGTVYAGDFTGQPYAVPAA